MLLATFVNLYIRFNWNVKWILSKCNETWKKTLFSRLSQNSHCTKNGLPIAYSITLRFFFRLILCSGNYSTNVNWLPKRWNKETLNENGKKVVAARWQFKQSLIHCICFADIHRIFIDCWFNSANIKVWMDLNVVPTNWLSAHTKFRNDAKTTWWQGNEAKKIIIKKTIFQRKMAEDRMHGSEKKLKTNKLYRSIRIDPKKNVPKICWNIFFLLPIFLSPLFFRSFVPSINRAPWNLWMCQSFELCASRNEYK